MAHFFTLDRARSLQAGQSVDLEKWTDVEPPELQLHLNYLFPRGVSRHGERYIVKGTIPATDISANIELLSEYVRRSHFPNRPSRFHSFFGCQSLQDIQVFRATFGQPNDVVWEVDAEAGFIGDMRFLTLEGSLLMASHYAHQYWSGAETDEPLWEVLLLPPVRVLAEASA